MADITRKMLNFIREAQEKTKKYTAKPLNEDYEEKEQDNFLTRSKILMEEAVNEKKKINEEESNNETPENGFVIRANDTQFGNLRSSQEDTLRKTLGEVQLSDDALVYYKDDDNVVLNGMIKGLGIKFTFKLNDKTGDGCYVTMADTQLSDANAKTIEKIRAAFQNWKSVFVEDGTVMKDLEKAAGKDKE